LHSCSRDLVSGPCSEPYESSPHPAIIFYITRFNITRYSNSVLGIVFNLRAGNNAVFASRSGLSEPTPQDTNLLALDHRRWQCLKA